MSDQLVRKHADPDIVEVNLHFKSLETIQRTPSLGNKLRYLDLSSNNLRRIENLNNLDGLCELRLDCCMLTEVPRSALRRSIKPLFRPAM